MKKVRCAIYTRKSTEEGLEQDFNSLHAQREACAAYVLSQASEGWSLLNEEYDDGGISGGTLERPALQRLLADIGVGKVDIVVVYKVDRLTRSLLDFSKLVEAFDHADVSFVSVTQSFNTTTSMGRLTLNMLLSFAQFEREVTAERIRDKIAASKAKGMWMGGTTPLGYRPEGRTLMIVPEHAEVIRAIFREYLEVGSVRLLQERLAAKGIRAPERTASTGRRLGGGTFSRGQLYAILANPTYAGMIRHKLTLYNGQHPAIVETGVWEEVQDRLADNTRGTRQGARTATCSLLAGLVVDEHGEPLIATHACKGAVRYRYYVSKGLHLATNDGTSGIRMNAVELEKTVAAELAKQFTRPLILLERAGLNSRPEQLEYATSACRDAAAKLRGRSPELLRALITRVEVGHTCLRVEIGTSSLATCLRLQVPDDAPLHIVLEVHAQLRRSGKVVRLVHADGTAAGEPEPQQHLIKLLSLGKSWWQEMRNLGLNASEIAVRHKVDKSYVSRLVRLNFLAPDIVQQILAGEQVPSLNARRLLALRDLPLSWTEQRQHLLAY